MVSLVVVFRCDASNSIGSGHIVRCMTLANELRTRSCEIIFVTRDSPGNMIDYIRSNAFDVIVLPSLTGGVSQLEDLSQTFSSLPEQVYSWVVVDHYALDEVWEKKAGEKFDKVLVIDDMADRRHACDILLDHNYANHYTEKYAGLVSDETLQLLGPEYVLLKPEYRKKRSALRRNVERVFVYFGGAEVANLNSMVLEVMSKSQYADLQIDLVAGQQAVLQDDILEIVERRGGVTIHQHLPHLADLMSAADLAIGAGGGATWERLCVGTPSIVITLADNQEPAVRSLHADGYVCHIGEVENVSSNHISEALENIIYDFDTRRRMHEKGVALVDGKGAERVARYIYGN